MLVTQLTPAWSQRARRGALVSGVVAAAFGIAGFSGHAFAQVTDGNFTGGSPTASYNLPSSGNSNTVTANDPTGWTTTMAGGPGGYELGCVVVKNSFNGCSIGATSTEIPSAQAGYTGNYLAVEVDTLNGFSYMDSISENIALTAKQVYTLTFDVAASETECGNSNVGATCVPNSNINWAVSVAGNTMSGNTSTTINIASNAATAWQAETVTFTAAATGNAMLQFLASSSTAGPPIALLDNIVLTPGSPGGKNNPVPEPASLVVLGAGLIGLVAMRRRYARLAA